MTTWEGLKFHVRILNYTVFNMLVLVLFLLIVHFAVQQFCTVQ